VKRRTALIPDEGSRSKVTDEQEGIAMAMQQALAVFAGLREQMSNDGPEAVAASLKSMPESDLRQIVLALVVTTERAAEESG
jgi:hypothetical protein